MANMVEHKKEQKGKAKVMRFLTKYCPFIFVS